VKKLLVLGATMAALAIPAGVSASTITQVMKGLDNPKGLAFGPEGGLYVAEAGRGGPPSALCAQGPDPGPDRCYGPTGAISRYWHGTQARVVTGLPSLETPNFAGPAAGPQHISFQGRGGMYVTIGFGGAPSVRDSVFAGLGFGLLLKIEPSDVQQTVADIGAYEGANNPDGQQVDTNPYAVLAQPGHQLVTDAGGNSLLDVRANGSISTVTTFPKVIGGFGPADAVPTEVVLGPDGAYYVSNLSGVPFTPGSALVWRVMPDGSKTVYAAGLTQVTDIAFGPEGSLYVLQHGTTPFFGGPGSIIRIAPGGARTTIDTQGRLSRPAGLVVGPDGALYVANFSTAPNNGEVLKIVP
jgi:DNA-binding beta-propeller fold protein YncE